MFVFRIALTSLGLNEGVSNGTVDIDGIWQLRTVQGDFPRYKDFSERDDVQLVGEQWFRLVPGSEYVAANPMEIPQLHKLIKDCATDVGDIVFQTLPHFETVQDPFQSLSPELRSMLPPRIQRCCEPLSRLQVIFSAASNILQESNQAGEALGLETSGSGRQRHGLVHYLE